eukprot:14129100-Alexandrium_andersonii.AAC.1
MASLLGAVIEDIRHLEAGDEYVKMAAAAAAIPPAARGALLVRQEQAQQPRDGGVAMRDECDRAE